MTTNIMVDIPYTLSEHKKFISRLKQRRVTANELKINFERAVSDLKADLAKLTLNELVKKCNFITTRHDVFEQAYEICLMEFVLGKVIVQKIYCGEDFANAVRRQIVSITDAEIQQKMVLQLQQNEEKSQ